MTTVCLVNEVNLSTQDMQTLVDAVTYHTNLVAKAWGLAPVTITSNAPGATDWKVYITERGRKQGALGYHQLEKGIPVAYCSPKASYKTFGVYSKPFIVKGKVINGARYRSGLATVICHEVSEALIDPAINVMSTIDSKGRAWLKEVADPVAGSFLLFTDPISKVDVVLPDIVTPAFYDVKGVAPYSLKSSISAPFTLGVSGYAYYRNAAGVLTKI